MIITISGKAGSGKSTIAKLLSKKLNLKHYSTGDFMRQMAKEKGTSLLELSKIAETDRNIDKELDKRQEKLGKEEDNFVIDGRLSAYFIPKAKFKIFLDCNDEVRAERILKDAREEEKSDDKDGMLKKIKQREESERKRYKEYYGYDYHDKANYNLLIDTSNLTVEQIIKKLIEFIKTIFSKKKSL